MNIHLITDHPQVYPQPHDEAWESIINVALQSIDKGFSAIEEAIFRIDDMESAVIQAKISLMVAEYAKVIHRRNGG